MKKVYLRLALAFAVLTFTATSCTDVSDLNENDTFEQSDKDEEPERPPSGP